MNAKTFGSGRAVFRGIGQIMLQPNGWTGALFLAGIAYGSYLAGIAALLAVLTGTLTAKLLNYDQAETEQGLYGFSAALVGVALTFYFKPVPVIWLAIIAGAAIATVIQHALIQKKLPGFTFPFILVSWSMLYLFHHVYVVPDSLAMTTVFPDSDELTTPARGFGEVIFQGSEIAGIIFFLAVFINRPVAALYGAVAALLSAFISIRFGEPAQDIHMGLFSFNAVLCAITFAEERPAGGFFVLFAVILSVLIEIMMLKMNYAVLTFPFVAASWITLTLQKLLPTKWEK